MGGHFSRIRGDESGAKKGETNGDEGAKSDVEIEQTSEDAKHAEDGTVGPSNADDLLGTPSFARNISSSKECILGAVDRDGRKRKLQQSIASSSQPSIEQSVRFPQVRGGKGDSNQEELLKRELLSLGLSRESIDKVIALGVTDTTHALDIILDAQQSQQEDQDGSQARRLITAVPFGVSDDDVEIINAVPANQLMKDRGSVGSIGGSTSSGSKSCAIVDLSTCTEAEEDNSKMVVEIDIEPEVQFVDLKKWRHSRHAEGSNRPFQAAQALKVRQQRAAKRPRFDPSGTAEAIIRKFISRTEHCRSVADHLEVRTRRLREEDRWLVFDAWYGPDSDDVVVELEGVKLTRHELKRMQPKEWVSDELLSFYMLLLQRRDDFKCSQDDTQLGSLFFTPLLFSRLLEDDWYCYDRVMNWVRADQDVFSKEKLFFPIHQPGHWGLLVVYVQRRTIKYYDSLGCDGNKYLCAARQWLRNEHLAKKGIELNTSQWVLEDMEKNVPQQKGGYDCGVFTMLCADYLSEDLPLAYRHTQIITHRENITESMLPAMDLMIS